MNNLLEKAYEEEKAFLIENYLKGITRIGRFYKIDGELYVRNHTKDIFKNFIVHYKESEQYEKFQDYLEKVNKDLENASDGYWLNVGEDYKKIKLGGLEKSIINNPLVGGRDAALLSKIKGKKGRKKGFG